MRRTLRVLKYAVTAAVLVAGGALTYLYARKPDMAEPASLVVERTPERIARGRYLFNLADCDGCHSERDFSRFGGPVIEGRRGVGTVFPKDLGLPGLVAPPNITPDPETGLGKWTDGEKIRAIREGVGRDGRTLFPLMPYESFRHMSDEDVYSLVAFLSTLKPVRHIVPKTEIDFPAALLIKSAPKPAGHVEAPDRNNTKKYGEYLVTIAGCKGCHTPSFGGGDRIQLAPNMLVVSANISSDRHTGIGTWSERYFIDRFAQYRDYARSGPPKAGPTSFTVMPWLNFSQLPDRDLEAIYAFISSVPPVSNAVETHPHPGTLAKR